MMTNVPKGMANLFLTFVKRFFCIYKKQNKTELAQFTAPLLRSQSVSTHDRSSKCDVETGEEVLFRLYIFFVVAKILK